MEQIAGNVQRVTISLWTTLDTVPKVYRAKQVLHGKINFYLQFVTGNEDYYTHTDCQGMGCGFDFRVNETLDYGDSGNYSTFIYTERAREIITNHDVEQPLFLYMPYQAVHFPLQVCNCYIQTLDRITQTQTH